MLQSTWLDLVLGVDVHIMLVPTPAGPVPAPLPHPFTGIVLDPMGAAMNAAMNGGVVLVNGLFATNCGTGVMNLPPHLPVPGPFAKGKPENDAELWFGAGKVGAGGASRPGTPSNASSLVSIRTTLHPVSAMWIGATGGPESWMDGEGTLRAARLLVSIRTRPGTMKKPRMRRSWATRHRRTVA